MNSLQNNLQQLDFPDLPIVNKLKTQSPMMLIFFRNDGHFTSFGADAVEAAFCLHKPLWFRPGRVQIKSECLSIRLDEMEPCVLALINKGNPVALVNLDDKTELVHWPIKLAAPVEVEESFTFQPENGQNADGLLLPEKFTGFGESSWTSQGFNGWEVNKEIDQEVPF